MNSSDRFNEIEREIERLRREADEGSAAFLDAYGGKKDNTNLIAVIGLVVVVCLSVIHVSFGILSAICFGCWIYAIHQRNTELQARVDRTLSRIYELRDEQEKL